MAGLWKSPVLEEGTSEAASFSKPYRRAFNFAEIPEITDEAIEFSGKHGENYSECK